MQRKSDVNENAVYSADFQLREILRQIHKISMDDVNPGGTGWEHTAGPYNGVSILIDTDENTVGANTLTNSSGMPGSA
jgi:hypothetical protein